MFTTNSGDSITMKFVSIISAFVLVAGVFPITTFGLDTGYKSPTDTQSPNDWSNAEGVYLDGDNQQFATGWAVNLANGEEQGYDELNFASIANDATINGIEVLVDAKAGDNSCGLGVKLSWNDGSSYTSQKTSTLNTNESTVTFGGANDNWGHTWTGSEFTNANFVIKLQAIDADGSGNNGSNDCRHGSDNVEVDWVRVKVHYTAAPVDQCPNVSGTQTSTPCADTTCVNNGGTWTNNSCVYPEVVICHATGNDWNAHTVSANGWNGHSGHENDFLVTDNTPCPPVVEDTDADDDGDNDDVDNCPADANADQADQDNDGIGDVCDNDIDGDEVSNGSDNCPVDENSDQEDADNDDIGDECDDYDNTNEDICEEYGGEWVEGACVGLEDDIICTVFALLGLPLPEDCNQDPVDLDLDNDGVEDEDDNCDSVENPGQEDSDNDGIGDACDSGEGNEGGGDEGGENEENNTPSEEPRRGGTTNTVCDNNQDDDNDGLYDENDPGCEDNKDGSEENAVGGGEVAGASCGPILNSFLGLRGKENDPEAVKVVQEFLNKELGLSLEVNGEYNAETIEAVKAFQAKYLTDVLNPWGIGDSTGIVYLTTQRMINMIACPGLDLPMPELN